MVGKATYLTYIHACKQEVTSDEEEEMEFFGHLFREKNINNLSVFLCPSRKEAIPPFPSLAFFPLLASEKTQVFQVSLATNSIS
jgi:hypothetical protein